MLRELNCTGNEVELMDCDTVLASSELSCIDAEISCQGT